MNNCDSEQERNLTCEEIYLGELKEMLELANWRPDRW